MENSMYNEITELPLDIYLLPDDILVHIFSMLSFKDLLNIRESCKKFYRLIDNNRYRVSIKNASRIVIESNKKWGRSTFGLRIDIIKPDLFKGINLKMFTKNDIENGNELSKSFNFFDIKNLFSLNIIDCGSGKIFKSLKNSFKNVTQLNTVYIDRVGIHDFEDLQNLIENLGNIKHLEIRHICIGKPKEEEKESDKMYPSLMLPSTTTLERLILTECENTKILDNNLMKQLIYNNKNLRVLEVSSTNDIFTKQLINDFLKAQETTTKSNLCDHTEVTLFLKCTYGIDETPVSISQNITLFVHGKNLSKVNFGDLGKHICIFNFCGNCKQLHSWINIMFGSEDKYHNDGLSYY
ncbi:F-box domain-containing protein [Strongyloides ratti]|uniref:F-box domain-containing protein n=1 Tax=Strongyloides ratti TaxID=34506 RepID=A0A090LA84_STRRB|nr:F-box domain-containing protein [Strongyloides ratti]CEF64435.1 F-box domain-containing protein [Strongyloides ratti]